MRNPTKAVWGVVLALALAWPVPALASPRQSGKLDKFLQDGSPTAEPQSVIIRAKPGRRAAVNERVGRHTRRHQVHALIDGVGARLTRQQILELANDPDVDGISIDADVTASGKPATGKAATGKPATYKLPTSSTAVIGDVKQILGLGNGYTGSGVTVAVIDSGISLAADFDLRILGQYVFASGKPGVPSIPFDDYGHGTHIAGLIGSNGFSSNNKYAGIAPGVKFLSLKVLDRRGIGKTSSVINALAFAVANRTRYNIKVINLSLGHPVYESAKTDPLVQAVEAAVRAGIVVVVAAGNYGYSPVTGQAGYAGIASPGNAPSAITVGAAVTNGTVSRADDRLASYSSRGPSWYDGMAKPDILSPGQAMISTGASGSTLVTDYPSLVSQSGIYKYLKLSGSSMATGVVAGLAAVMIEANQDGAYLRWQQAQARLRKPQRTAFVAAPALKSNTIKALLQYTATQMRDGTGAVYGPLEQGAGLVNGFGAVTLAHGVDTTKPAGEYWMTFDMHPSTSFGGSEEAWSQTVIWGTRLLRGTSVIDMHQLAWEDNIVWGTGELDTMVWGTALAGEDNIVWGTALDEDNIVWGTSIPIGHDLAWAGNASLEDNIVWGTGMFWDDNVVWGAGLVGFFDGLNIVWGTVSGDEDNIVWGTLTEDNIVWGTSASRVSVLGANIGGAR